VERDFATEQAARVFAGALRASDLAARLTDDRFVALCSDVDEDFRRDLKMRLELAFDHFNRNAAKPYKLGCRLIFCTVAIGSEASVLANFLDHPEEDTQG
jgi:GGDEF domain-containing protein